MAGTEQTLWLQQKRSALPAFSRLLKFLEETSGLADDCWRDSECDRVYAELQAPVHNHTLASLTPGLSSWSSWGLAVQGRRRVFQKELQHFVGHFEARQQNLIFDLSVGKKMVLIIEVIGTLWPFSNRIHEFKESKDRSVEELVGVHGVAGRGGASPWTRTRGRREVGRDCGLNSSQN